MSTIKLKANESFVATDNSPIYMTSGDTLTYAYNKPITDIVHMGGGVEKIFDNDPYANITVYGGSGTDTITAQGINASSYPKMTFIGGTGTATVNGVLLGFGGEGQTTMYGAINSHLYEGVGPTDFGMMANNCSVTVESFTHGQDHLTFANMGYTVAQETAILASASTANGYVALNLNSVGSYGTIKVATDTLTMADFK